MWYGNLSPARGGDLTAGGPVEVLLIRCGGSGGGWYGDSVVSAVKCGGGGLMVARGGKCLFGSFFWGGVILEC